MAAFTITVVGTNTLGKIGEVSYVTGKVTFAGETIATTDTFTGDLFVMGSRTIPVEILDFTLFSTATVPASLSMQVGNSNDADGFMAASVLTESNQSVRKGNGALMNTRVNNKAVTMTCAVDAGAGYTGDLVLRFAVRRTND